MYSALRPEEQLEAPGRGGKSVSLALSAALHVAVIAAMVLLPGARNRYSSPTLYEQEIEPHKDKIIWYRLTTLPTIAPEARARVTGAARINKDTIVSHLPDAPVSAQLNWTERPRPEPKEFKAPDMISVRKQTKLVDNVPQLAPEAAGKLKAAQLEIPKLAPKPFVAPGEQHPERKRAHQLAMSDAPTLTQMEAPSGYDSALAAVSAASGVKAPKPFTAPAGRKPGARLGSGTVAELGDAPGLAAGGSSEVNALVLNTLHSALSGGLPPPSNSNVSVGPRVGSDAGGAGSGLRIPGVTVQPGGRSPVPPQNNAARTMLTPPPFIATSVAPLKETFSAPMAPSSRSIPAAIEARFHNRVVYTVVLPMRKVPGYSADWIMWFAEHQPENGVGTLEQVRAPLPIKKVYRMKADSVLPSRIQFAATIDRTGRIASIKPIGAPAGVPVEAAVEDFGQWEFLPALRNRVPVDVDVVVEVTFSNTTALTVIHPSSSTAGN